METLVDSLRTKAEVLAIGPANWFSLVARELAKHDMALFSSSNHDVILNRIAEVEHNALAVVVKQDEQTVELCRQIDLLRSYIGWRTPLPKIIICRTEGPCPAAQETLFARSGVVRFLPRHELDAQLWSVLSELIFSLAHARPPSGDSMRRLKSESENHLAQVPCASPGSENDS